MAWKAGNGLEFPDELKFIVNRNLPQRKCSESLAGKTCVITGATSGVGLEAAKRFAEQGAKLVVIARNEEKAVRLQGQLKSDHGAEVELVIADMGVLQQVRRAASEVLAKCPRIDILINSAGVYCTSRTYTQEGFETTFCVNHLAPFLFTGLLLDRVKESAPARIIQVNSEGHRFNGLNPDDLNWRKRIYTGLRGYGASKTAQLLTVWELSDMLEGTGVTINAMHPGDVRTNIGNNNGPLYRFFLHNFTWHFLRDPKMSGEAIYYLAASPELEGISGRFYHMTNEEKPAKHALDRKMGKRIWELSLGMTGLKDIKLQGLNDRP